MYKSYKSIHGNDKSQEAPLIWPLVGSTICLSLLGAISKIYEYRNQSL